MKKDFVFYIHSTAGLLSGLFILLMSLSGAALVFHDEADSFQKPFVNNTSYNSATVDQCYINVQQAYPKAQISNCVIPENKFFRPWSFFIYDSSYEAGTKVKELFLNSETGKLMGYRGGSDDIKHNFILAVFLLKFFKADEPAGGIVFNISKRCLVFIPFNIYFFYFSNNIFYKIAENVLVILCTVYSKLF